MIWHLIYMILEHTFFFFSFLLSQYSVEPQNAETIFVKVKKYW